MLALTMGDPAGIGAEITAGAWRVLREVGPEFVVLGDPMWLTAHVPVQVIEAVGDARFAQAVPVLPIHLACPAQPGHPDAANAPAIIASIEAAARLAQSGAVAGMVTNPISKAVLQSAGFAYPGHTEFLAALTGAAGCEVMMLASPMLRVVPVTIHVSLRRALDTLSTAGIVAIARVTHAALIADFGIAHPRLAIAGLNPHAGEDGRMGGEEAALIRPAIEQLRGDGLRVTGPWPPDTMFTDAARQTYDAAICMYHDQALIPIKTLDFDGGVNVTLGLPFVRTSPDHGTAYDIAGKGLGRPDSLIAALKMAHQMAAARLG